MYDAEAAVLALRISSAVQAFETDEEDEEEDGDFTSRPTKFWVALI